MKLSNQQLLNYVGRIKLTREMKAGYVDQIDNLIVELTDKINANTSLQVTRVLRAGSWKKGTALRPRAEHPLDIDLVFFLDIDEADAEDVQKLHDKLLTFLLAAYKNKKKEDFTGGHKTVGLVFRGSGLRADLVPVVPLKTSPGYVWQPSVEPGGGRFVTSVEGQLKFAQARKEANPNYTSVVRTLKAWKARQELKLSSFSIELLVAHLELTRGSASNIEDAVVRFFEFVCSAPFPTIQFPGAAGVMGVRTGPAYVADPTHNPNNVFDRLATEEWTLARQRAETAWETLSFAQSKSTQGETIALWKEVFGPYFNVTPEET